MSRHNRTALDRALTDWREAETTTLADIQTLAVLSAFWNLDRPCTIRRLSLCAVLMDEQGGQMAAVAEDPAGRGALVEHWTTSRRLMWPTDVQVLASTVQVYQRQRRDHTRYARRHPYAVAVRVPEMPEGTHHKVRLRSWAGEGPSTADETTELPGGKTAKDEK